MQIYIYYGILLDVCVKKIYIVITQELLQMHESEVRCEEKGGEVIPRPINSDDNI